MPTEDIALLRFERFRATFVSSNLPDSMLLDLIESYIKADDPAVQPIPVLDGQLTLY